MPNGARGPCVFVETCEHARSSWTSFWGQIPSFHHILRGVSNDSQKLIRTAHHRSHDPLTQLCHSHWSCQGFRRPWTWAWHPHPAVCQDVALDLLFMATPCLSEAFLGMRRILNARAGAWWQDVLGELQTHMCLPCWLALRRFLVHHMDGGMEGERGGRRDGWLKGSGWTVPSPTPGAGQHLPGLVQTLPNPYFTSLLLPV